MQIKLARILNAHQTLQKFASNSFSALTAWDLMVILKKLSEHYEQYAQIVGKIREKYGKFNEEQNTYVLDPSDEENVVKANKEHEDLINKEIEIECPKIKLSELTSEKVSIMDLIEIEWLIEDDRRPE